MAYMDLIVNAKRLTCTCKAQTVE